MRDLTILFIHLLTTIAKQKTRSQGTITGAYRGHRRDQETQYLPLSHPFVEGLIGTIRREYLDLVPFWTAHDLENKLLSFKAFYNDQRCHYALDGDTPSERNAKIRTNVAGLDSYRWRSHCRGL